jgi:hypothetical protein
LAHLLPSLGHKKLATPGKKKKQTDTQTREKDSELLPSVQLDQKRSHP